MARAKRTDLLVLSAHAPELAGLRAGLGPQLAGTVSGVRVVCGTVGVGMPAAGAGVISQLRELTPRAAVLIGSCGLYPKRAFTPLACLVPDRIALLDAAVIGGKGALPAPMQSSLETDPGLSRGLLRSPGTFTGALGTTLAITTDDALARRLERASGCAGENLEAFAVGLACASLSIPFSALLAVTNVVGGRGRRQWARHQRRAAERSGQLLLDWLERGAEGLPSRRA